MIIIFIPSFVYPASIITTMPKSTPLNTAGPLPCALTGAALLNHPFFNKGSAFPPSERREFNLTGLLPERVQTLEQQAERAHRQYLSRDGSLARNTFLTSLKEQNEVLFYKVRKIMPIVLCCGGLFADANCRECRSCQII